MGIAAKLWPVMATAVVCFLAIIALTVAESRDDLITDRKTEIRHIVDVAHSLLGWYQAEEQAGRMTRDQAQQAALAAVRALRYDKTEYLWINDQGKAVPRMVMHPTVPALDGTVLDAAKFNKTTFLQAGLSGAEEKAESMNLFVAFNTVVARAGEGYVGYQWPKPKAGGGVTAEMFPKLSYVKGFAPWSWVIGSGLYVDDLDAAIRARTIVRPLASVTDTLERLARDETGVEIRHDEIGTLARGLVAFREHIVAAAEAAIGEIARNIEQAAASTREVSGGIGEVSQTAQGTGSTAGEVLAAAGGLGTQAAALRRDAEAFLTAVRVVGAEAA